MVYDDALKKWKGNEVEDLIFAQELQKAIIHSDMTKRSANVKIKNDSQSNNPIFFDADGSIDDKNSSSSIQPLSPTIDETVASGSSAFDPASKKIVNREKASKKKMKFDSDKQLWVSADSVNDPIQQRKSFNPTSDQVDNDDPFSELLLIDESNEKEQIDYDARRNKMASEFMSYDQDSRTRGFSSSDSNPYNLSRLNSWRSQYEALQTSDSQDLNSSLLALPDDSRFTTSLAISSESPLIAIGSGSYDTNLFFVQTSKNDSEDTKAQINVKAFFASKFPIYSLSFQSNLLITGTERSAAVLYQISKSQLVGDNSSPGDKDQPLVRCVGTYKNKAAKSIETAAAGSHISSRRVHIVSFSPGTENDTNRAAMSLDSSSEDYWPPGEIDIKSNIFFSCLGGTVNVWDTNINSKALRIEKLSSQPLSAAEWSPHAPFNLIVGGSVDGSINVFDLRKRGRGLSWNVQYGDSKFCINDVAVNPFVPYWVASASDDGTANIWDLRYTSSGKPAATVGKNQIYGSVTKLCWSKNYVDLLATGSSDRHFRLFNLRPNSFVNSVPTTSELIVESTRVDSNVVADRIGAEDIGSIVGIVNGSSSKSELFYSLSDCGDLYSHSISSDLLFDSAPHLINKAVYPREYRAESQIYSRDIAKASVSAIEFVDSLLLQREDRLIINNIVDSSKLIRQLCDLFKAKLVIQPDSWKFPPPLNQNLTNSEDLSSSESDPLVIQQKFAEKLAELSYGLPPGFSLEDVARRESSVMAALEKLNMANLRTKLHDLISEFKQNENSPESEQLNAIICQKLSSREQQLITYLKIQPLLFDTELLKDVAKIILSHDCIRGLSFGVSVCETYFVLEKKGLVKCTDLTSLVHVLLAPTIFDPEELDTSKSTTKPNSSQKSVDGKSPTEEADGANPSNLDVVQIRNRIRSYLAINPLLVLEMVKLEIKVQETVLKGGDQVKVADRIIQHMASHAKIIKTLLLKSNQINGKSANSDFMFGYLVNEIRPEFPSTITLSAAATRLFLNALIQMRAYDEYLANVKFWLSHYPSRLVNYPLTQVLTPQTFEVVVPRFKRQLDVVVSTINKEPLGLEPRIYRDIILKLANALTKCELDKTEIGMVTHPTPSNSPAKQTAAKAPAHGSNLLTIDRVIIYFDTISKAFISVLEALSRHNEESRQRASREISPLIQFLDDITAKYSQKEISAFIESAKKYQIQPKQ
ncbi:Histone acetyltransferase type B subunit 2 [Smittium mucronatum]|uniref:Histone acetyltransferase type B subunit 2 n=1 Tax=Smittium mucronatum TaxID=133383 RepID=A0A1R0H289_9FUNG|nr:Histone acetyltransferase type B subunit 2 [Smittium mucronatum]